MPKKPTQKVVKKIASVSKKKPLKSFKKIIKNLKSKFASKPLKKQGIEKLVLLYKDEIVSNGSKPNEEQNSSPKPGWLPASYGDNKLVLMVRDPWWLYSYWEVTSDKEAEILFSMDAAGHQCEKKVLRVYDITGTSPEKPNSYFDIEVYTNAGNWYVDVGAPDKEWIAELGLRTTQGGFYVFVRSNAVRTPRYGVSDVIDEEWMLLEEFYWKIFGISAGSWGPKSSLNVREVLERYLRSLRSLESGSGFRLDTRLAKNAARSRTETPEHTINS